MLTFKMQMDQGGFFRIVAVRGGIYPDLVSPWTNYRGVARLEVDGKNYIAVTAYYEDILPHETVMEVRSALPTTLEDVERLREESQQERVVASPT